LACGARGGYVECVRYVWCGDVVSREAYGVGACSACGVGCMLTDFTWNALCVRWGVALAAVPIEQGVDDAFALHGSRAACVGRGTRAHVAVVVSTGECT
jgi:hypothetical protein